MIKISKLADYAIQIAQVLIENNCLSASKIAEKSGIPEPTVSKILKKLTEAKILISLQGPKGGYQLLKPAEKISLADLITAMDGKPAMTACCSKDYDCAQDPVCHQQHNWQMINHLIFSVLNRISLLDMKNTITKTQMEKIQALHFIPKRNVSEV